MPVMSIARELSLTKWLAKCEDAVQSWQNFARWWWDIRYTPVRQTLSIRIEERCAWLFKRARCIAAATGQVSIPIEKLPHLHSRTPDGTTNVLHELCGRHLVTLRSCRYMQLYECYRMLIWVQLFDTISGVSWSCHLFCHKSAGMTVSPPLSDRAWTPQSRLRNQGRRAGSGSTMTETAV